MRKSKCLILFVTAVAGLLPVFSCVPTAPPTSPSELQPLTDAQKSQIEEAREEAASNRLREPNRAYWQNVSALLQSTLSGSSRARGLAAPEPVGLRVVTADWAKRKWGDDYVRENSAKIEIDERIYKGLFVLPDAVSLAGLYADWPRSYLATALGDRVYFVQENLAGLNGEDVRRILAHEVVHLLQNKNFETPQMATYDEDKAWSGLVEGDADFTRDRYLEGMARVKPADIGRLVTSPPAAPQSARPPALTRLLYFPYEYGQPFVSALYQKGGWPGVNESYPVPPVTTQQVMHPEKYLAGKAPRAIPALPLNIAGWQEKRVDRLGEYFVRVMLESWLPAAEAGSAARGWAGDRLTYYEGPRSYLFTWQTAWDADPDAARFYDAFLRMLTNAGATTIGADLWSCRGGYLWVGKTDGVTIIASPERGMVDAVRRAWPAIR